MTVNAALGRTCNGSALTPGAARRAGKAHAQAGGKGPEVARARRGAGVALLGTDLAARSTGKQTEKSRRRRTPFAEAHRNASECVLPQACNQQMSSQAHKEGER